MIPSGQTALGRALRWPLRLIPSDLVVPVLSGPNRGLLWVVGSSTHGCWIGTYERGFAETVERHLQDGMVFYDLGANVGYYTLLGARSVGASGQVVAFEPLPRNVEFLRRHISINGIENVQVVPAAVVDEEGAVGLTGTDSPSQARVADKGLMTVDARTLDGMSLPPPDVIKMDVEGAELKVLEGATDLLRRRKPLLLFSTHGKQLESACYEVLADFGYRVRPLESRLETHLAEPE